MKQPTFSKMAWAGVLIAALSLGANAGKASPLQKVITLMTQLQGQVIREGELSKVTYDRYSKWCEKTSKGKQHEISEAKDNLADLEAMIDKSKSDAEEAQARVEVLSGALATDAQDVKAIGLIRDKEKNEFEEMDKELTSTITTISKARSVLKKSLDKAGLKAGAAFLQNPTKGMQQFTAAVSALVSVSMGVSADSREKLSALVETDSDSAETDNSEAEDHDEAQDADAPHFQAVAQDPQGPLRDPTPMDAGATHLVKIRNLAGNSLGGNSLLNQPKPAVYKAKGGSILELLEKMEEEAQAAQAKLRKHETKEKHNCELLRQRLSDRIKTQNKELEEQKKELALAGEKQASAKGKIENNNKDLVEDKKYLKKLQQGCMERASEFQMEMKTRNDELSAIGAAKKTVQSIVFVQVQTTSSTVSTRLLGDDQDQDEGLAFLQVGSEMSAEASQQMYALRTAGNAVANKLHQLAGDEHSVALAQLSSRVSATLRYLQKGKRVISGDPFKKIKNMIQSMIGKLEKQQAEESKQKQFCDKEMSESKASKLDREGKIETLSSRIESGVAEVAKLNQQKAALLGEIKDVETAQGEMDSMRQGEHKAYKKVSKELQQGLAAVQTALKVLREFYSQDDKEGSFIQDMGANMKSASKEDDRSAVAGSAAYAGAGGGTAIIGMLEVCESDFSKGLAEGQAEEDAAQEEYEKLTLENKKERAVKDKTVTNIGSEVARLEKKTAEFTGDRSETQQELDALLEYFAKLTKQCVAQPESYHDRVARRKREIDGLEQALSMLMSQDGPSDE